MRLRAMADHQLVQNVVILQPREVGETCCKNQPAKTQSVHRAEESCLDRQAGRGTQRSFGIARSSAFSMRKDEDIVWKRIEPSDFKPFYDTSNSRVYTYSIKPPLLQAPRVCEQESISHLKYSNTLTDRLLRRGSKQASRNAQRELKTTSKEKWCIFDKELEELSQYDRSEVASRCHAIVRPLVSTVDTRSVWSQVSEAIRSGQLPNTNSCLKASEDAVHIFYFASNEDLINEHLLARFSGLVKLEKVL